MRAQGRQRRNGMTQLCGSVAKLYSTTSRSQGIENDIRCGETRVHNEVRLY